VLSSKGLSLFFADSEQEVVAKAATLKAKRALLRASIMTSIIGDIRESSVNYSSQIERWEDV
jgi:hypothetical protein